MLQKFEINGVHATVDPDLRKYVTKKIGGVDRYISKHCRDSAHAEVHLKENKHGTHDPFRCEVTLFMPHKTIVVKESAQSMEAAVDIAESKLKVQLKKYKDTRGNGKWHRHLAARFRRREAT